MNTRRKNLSARERRGRVAKLLLASVLFAGLFIHIGMLAGISGQTKEAAALKGELVAGETVERAVESMRTLNRYAAECARGLAVHACTDVTGFGLAGHLCEMAEGSGLTATVSAGAFRLLPEALEMARMGVIPAGAYRNADHFGAGVAFDEDVENGMEDVLFDPQTSGGLLLALPKLDAKHLVGALRKEGLPAAVIGRALPCGEKSVVVA